MYNTRKEGIRQIGEEECRMGWLMTDDDDPRFINPVDVWTVSHNTTTSMALTARCHELRSMQSQI